MLEFTFEFEGQPLEVLQVDNEPMIDASHLSDVLGYKSRGAITDQIRRDWSSEFEEGRDYRMVAGSSIPGVSGNRGSNRPKLLLTESGWNLVFIKTRKPIGVALRRFLADEVLPQLSRTGQYTLGGPTHDDALAARVSRLEQGQEKLTEVVTGLTHVVSGLAKQIATLPHTRMPALGDGAAPARQLLVHGVPVPPLSIPERFSIRSLGQLARPEGCSAQTMKKRLQSVGLLDDDVWSWVGEETVMTSSGSERQQTVYAFRKGIMAELRRRERRGSQGPLFVWQGEE
ncbi:MAG: BRO family protein [Myxococcota bacterium]